MKETKFVNCEQYVLARMFSLEEEMQVMRKQIEELKSALATKNAVIATIKAYTNVNTHNDDVFINFMSVWEEYDNEDFKFLMKELDLKMPTKDDTSKED
jgi:hypothetical protein